MTNRYMRASKLTDSTFEAIALAFAQERPSGEVAQATGVSAKTIKKLYQVFANCLFGKAFHGISHVPFLEKFQSYAESGKDWLAVVKTCVLYCPAIINSDSGERGECHVCPAAFPLKQAPVAHFGAHRTIFLNRKFLAALDGYHLYARTHYFLVIEKLQDETPPGHSAEEVLAKRLLSHFERNPIDLRIFEQSWDGRINLYFNHAVNQRDLDPARPRSTLRRQG